MLSNETYEEALNIITDMMDELGELEPSLEGYIDLLEYAIEEIKNNLDSSRADLPEEN